MALSYETRNLIGGRLANASNGATFDNVILHKAFDAVGKRSPWSFRRDMCFRTMASMFPAVPRRMRLGTHHDSLDDARYQAQHLLDIFASIRTAK